MKLCIYPQTILWLQSRTQSDRIVLEISGAEGNCAVIFDVMKSLSMILRPNDLSSQQRSCLHCYLWYSVWKWREIRHSGKTFSWRLWAPAGVTCYAIYARFLIWALKRWENGTARACRRAGYSWGNNLMCWVGFRPGQPWKGVGRVQRNVILSEQAVLSVISVFLHIVWFFFWFSLVDVLPSFTMGVCLVGEQKLEEKLT